MASTSEALATRARSDSSSSATSQDTQISQRQTQPRRQSSIHFSQDTRIKSNSPMSSQRRSQSSSDEITPIRQSDGQEEAETAAKPSLEVVGSPPGATKANEETPAWHKRLAEKYGSISLENKASVARDHLALERTFLAWLRTSLAFASIGIAITQLFRLNTSIAKKSKRSEYRRAQNNPELPYSPLLGHSLSIEVLLQLQALQSQQSSDSDLEKTPTLGSTLLDQLLLLPPPEHPQYPNSYTYISLASGDDAAAKLRHIGKPLGATFIGISIVVLLVGFHRYFESQHWIIRGKFPASRGSIALVGFIAGALIVACLVVVLVVAPTSYET